MPIRDAHPDEWPSIWPFLSRVLVAGDTYTTPRDVSSDEATADWMAPPPNRTLVAHDDDRGTIVGIAKLRPNLPCAGSHARSRASGRLPGMTFNALVETTIGPSHCGGHWGST